MSWNAWLTDDRGHVEGDWNYTHNTNRMIARALEIAGEPAVEQCRGPLGPAIGPAWWDRLHGLSGPDGARLLDLIVSTMRGNEDELRALDPPNGWGSFDSLIKVLDEMARSVPEWPCTWEVHG